MRALTLHFQRLTVRGRIILSGLALVLPVSMALGCFLDTSLVQLRTASHARVRMVAEMAAGNIRHELAEARLAIARAAPSDGSAFAPRAACEAAARIASSRADALAVVVTGAAGELVCSRSSKAEGGSMAEELGAALNANALQDPLSVRMTRTKVPYVLVRHTVAAQGEARAADLWLALDTRPMNLHLAALIPPDVVVGVVDWRETVVLHSDPANAYVGTVARQPSEVIAASLAGHATAPGLDGVERLLATVAIEDLGWQVRAGTPLASINAQYDDIRQRAALVVLAMVLLTLVLAWRLSAGIVAPIHRLSTAAAFAAAGHDHERVRPDGPPEIVELATQFNRMVEVRGNAEARLNGILDTAVDAILTIDASQVIVLANPAAARLFGTTVEQLVGRPLDTVIPEASRPSHRELVHNFGRERADPRHMAHQREVQAQRSDGALIPVEVSISHLDVDGDLTYTAILRDITERVKAARSLSASEAMLRRLLMHLPEAVFVNTGMQLTFVNGAAQALFGGTEAELLGRSPLDLIHPVSRERALQRIRALKDGEMQVAPLEPIRIQRLDGSEREVESVGTLIEQDGKSSILVVLRDLSELRIAQRTLERSQADLRRLVAAMDEVQEQERLRISRDLHDDLQQTLAAIRMDAGMLAEATRHAPLLAADALRIDALAASAIVSTRRLISGLRPEILDELGLDPALQSLAATFEARTQIGCRYRCDDADELAQVEPRVATCLYRVAQEALNNVLKHSGATRVTMRLRRVADAWRLSVHDNGRGLQPADLDKGKSFGLIGMQERVRALGGSVRVESRTGRGTVVTATLPRLQPVAQ